MIEFSDNRLQRVPPSSRRVSIPRVRLDPRPEASTLAGNRRANAIVQAESAQASTRKQQGVVLSFIELAQSRIDVSRRSLKTRSCADVSVGPAGVDWMFRSSLPCAKMVSMPQLICSSGKHQRISRVFAFANGRDDQPIRDRWSANPSASAPPIDTSIQQRVFQLFRENTFAADH